MLPWRPPRLTGFLWSRFCGLQGLSAWRWGNVWPSCTFTAIPCDGNRLQRASRRMYEDVRTREPVVITYLQACLFSSPSWEIITPSVIRSYLNSAGRSKRCAVTLLCAWMRSSHLLLIVYQRKASVSRVGVCVFHPRRTKLGSFEELLKRCDASRRTKVAKARIQRRERV